MLHSSEFTEDMRDELVRDFMTEYRVSETTAQVATTVFLTIASSMPEEQASIEFQRTVQQSVDQGEPRADGSPCRPNPIPRGWGGVGDRTDPAPLHRNRRCDPL
ncbi:hypothetical protein [Streptomyces sp. NPDC058671]|uniref:hypothetical protein n=1 Tax=Streptomyces sp. NPDC058671 TaxID=3346590 RepID=UPI0036491F46